MAKKTLQTSETRIIKRSQIKLNPFNPKRHSDDEINKQLRNFKRVGYLGGIVWNETTGNLIDGHRRVFAQDIYYGNNKDSEVDYDIKVEVCQLDEKAEKEQMTFMSVANTKPDFQLIAEYISDVDFENVGLSEADYKAIMNFVPREDEPVQTVTLDDLVLNNAVFERPKTDYEQGMSDEEKQKRIEEIKAAKHVESNETYDANDDNLILSFRDAESKQIFLDFFGIFTQERIISGEVCLDFLAAHGYIEE